MRMLARREHSHLELSQKLTDYPPDEVAEALAKLQKQDYQSDKRFAADFVQMRFRQGKGKVLIQQHLKQKGIDDFNFKNYDFFALAKSIRLRKYGKTPPENYQEKSKQQRFLQSRGNFLFIFALIFY
ncbi:MAG: regulatory protein RecX, partial [Candidatus Thioglobus sp.]|nr:regulatory protein RecX [Candidatus Thioglobus sp.]